MSKESPIIYGEHDEKTLTQFNDVLSRADDGALMADGHCGYTMPIGGVAAYKNKVSPIGVGYDIGCGNLAVKLDIRAEHLNISDVLDIIQKEISFGIGQRNKNAPEDHPVFEDEKWKAFPSNIRPEFEVLARKQLGTVGSGNHYVDIFEDEIGYAWIGVHFGSRGLGYKTASGFLALSLGKDWGDKVKDQEVLLDLDTELGKDYFAAMELSGQYAFAGREWVCYTLAGKLGVKVIDYIHNNHNFAWRETHNGEEFIVVRKGSTPAFPEQRGFIGGSMGDDAVIIKGIDSEDAKKSLYSTVHGAGRVMSRTHARGKWKRKKSGGRWKEIQQTTGVISKEMMHNWLKEKGVLLRGGEVDEAPQVYRRLPDVLKYQDGKSIKILHTLRPLGVVMAGKDDFDPYA